MSGTFGLDKLGFVLPVEAVKFSPDFDASVRQPVTSSALGGDAGRAVPLYCDTSGRCVSGHSLLLNPADGDYQFVVKPDYRGGGSPLCLVQFSAGVFGDSNLLPLSLEAVGDAVSAVQLDLRERGAKLKLEGAKLFRLDVARNHALSEPVSSFMPVLQSVGARKSTRKWDFGGTGFYIGPDSKSWELALYDKGQHLKAKGFAGADCPANTLRAELRLMNGATIKSRLGWASATLPELRANWGTLAAVHRQSIEKELLRHRAEAFKPSPYDLRAMRDAAFASGSKAARDNFERSLGRVALIDKMGLPAAIQFECEGFASSSSDADRKKRDRIEKELKAANFWLMLHRPVRGRRPAGLLSLYQELEQTLLAA